MFPNYLAFNYLILTLRSQGYFVVVTCVSQQYKLSFVFFKCNPSSLLKIEIIKVNIATKITHISNTKITKIES